MDGDREALFHALWYRSHIPPLCQGCWIFPDLDGNILDLLMGIFRRLRLVLWRDLCGFFRMFCFLLGLTCLFVGYRIFCTHVGPFRRFSSSLANRSSSNRASRSYLLTPSACAASTRLGSLPTGKLAFTCGHFA